MHVLIRAIYHYSSCNIIGVNKTVMTNEPDDRITPFLFLHNAVKLKELTQERDALLKQKREKTTT